MILYLAVGCFGLSVVLLSCELLVVCLAYLYILLCVVISFVVWRGDLWVGV